MLCLCGGKVKIAPVGTPVFEPATIAPCILTCTPFCWTCSLAPPRTAPPHLARPHFAQPHFAQPHLTQPSPSPPYPARTTPSGPTPCRGQVNSLRCDRARPLNCELWSLRCGAAGRSEALAHLRAYG